MTLNTECYQLPLYCDTKRLAEELSQFADHDWISLSGDAWGESAIILVSVGGTLNQDFAISGPMETTTFMEHCLYFKQILKALKSPISRCRLVRLNGISQSQAQVGCNYHYFRRKTVCIPIITNPTVKFFSDEKSFKMAAGEVWIFDNHQTHWLCNEAEQACIHLIVETRGLFDFVRDSENSASFQKQNIPFVPEDSGQIPLESYRFEVFTPEEINQLTTIIRFEIQKTEIPENAFLILTKDIAEFKEQWEKAFFQFGHHSTGELTYQDLILCFREQIIVKANKWLRQTEQNAKCAVETITSMLLTAASAPKKKYRPFLIPKKRNLEQIHKNEEFQCPTFEKPIVLVSAPRAGSTLLFDTLSQFKEVWNIGKECHEISEKIPELHPAAKNYSSNRLTEIDAQPHILSKLQKRLTQQLQDRNEQLYLDLPIEQRPSTLRFLAKTPKNALRIPFIKALFPDALFLYLYRDPRENINSMMEGWRARRFVTYRTLPGWPFKYWEWNFLLIPGWAELQNCSLVEMTAHQWKTANAYILEDLENLPKTDWCIVPYTDLIQEPKKIISKISQFAGLQWDEPIEQRVSQSLPISRMTLSPPVPDKWRKRRQELTTILPIVEPIERRFEQLLLKENIVLPD